MTIIKYQRCDPHSHANKIGAVPIYATVNWDKPKP